MHALSLPLSCSCCQSSLHECWLLMNLPEATSSRIELLRSEVKSRPKKHLVACLHPFRPSGLFAQLGCVLSCWPSRRDPAAKCVGRRRQCSARELPSRESQGAGLLKKHSLGRRKSLRYKHIICTARPPRDFAHFRRTPVQCSRSYLAIIQHRLSSAGSAGARSSSLGCRCCSRARARTNPNKPEQT